MDIQLFQKLLNSGIYFPAIEQEVKARKQEPQLAS